MGLGGVFFERFIQKLFFLRLLRRLLPGGWGRIFFVGLGVHPRRRRVLLSPPMSSKTTPKCLHCNEDYHRDPRNGGGSATARSRKRLGSGDGERKTLLTRQIAFEPLPASVLFALGLVVADGHSASRLVCPKPVELHLGQKLRRDRITGAGANNRINAAERAHSGLTNT